MLRPTGRTEWKHALAATQFVPALIAGAMVSKLAHVHLNPNGRRVFAVAFSITSGAVLLLRV